ncbi:MAG: hypothetical protein FIA97_13005, partial [Methylococcaceae bacterium]|nr:hypothetical protein [Methylococcaceae bacterium]
MSLVAWILLGELLLVSVVAAVMAVVAGRVRQRRLVTAVAAMLDRLRSGESRRVKALSTRLAELYRLEAAAAEQLAQAVVAEEKRCTGALARALLGKDKDALKNLGDSLVKLSDRQLTATAAALAERLEALSKLDQGLAAAVPPEEGRGFSADQAGMPDVAEPGVAVEIDAEPGDGLVLEDSSRGDRDGPDGQSDPIPDLMPATEQAEQLSAALDLDGAPPIGLDGEGESAGADVGAGSGQRAGPEPVAARDRKARRRAADRPANPLWGIAPSDSGIPDELADTQQDSWERAGNQSADPSEESHDEAAEADPIPAMPGTDPSA